MRGAPVMVAQAGRPVSGHNPARAENPESGQGRQGLHRLMQSSLQTLYSYWNEVRAGRIAPQRLEIEPSRIGAILSQTFSLELLKPGVCPYRLAGTRVCELLGSELRGKNFLDGWGEAGRRRLDSHLATSGAQGAVVHLTLEVSIDARHRVA